MLQVSCLFGFCLHGASCRKSSAFVMQVAQETDVLDALTRWVEAQPELRTSLFKDMFGKPPWHQTCKLEMVAVLMLDQQS